MAWRVYWLVYLVGGKCKMCVCEWWDISSCWQKRESTTREWVKKVFAFVGSVLSLLLSSSPHYNLSHTSYYYTFQLWLDNARDMNHYLIPIKVIWALFYSPCWLVILYLSYLICYIFKWYYIYASFKHMILCWLLVGTPYYIPRVLS